MAERRATCLNCMDGRVQLPVLEWIKKNYAVDFVDVITEAGMNKFLAEESQDISLIIRSIKISLEINKAEMIFVVGHYDCRGNPVDKSVHLDQIRKAVERLKKSWATIRIVGLWVNDVWMVEKIIEQK